MAKEILFFFYDCYFEFFFYFFVGFGLSGKNMVCLFGAGGGGVVGIILFLEVLYFFSLFFRVIIFRRMLRILFLFRVFSFFIIRVRFFI